MGHELIELADGWIQNLGAWGYLIMAAAALVEYIFPPFPGDSTVALGGIWAWRANQSWLGVWIAVTLGNALGIWLQHRIGSALVKRVQGGESGRAVKRLKAWGLSENRVAAMQEQMRRRAVALLLINRFFPSFRALVFLAAGASGLSLKKTLSWGVLGSLVWSAFLLGIGAWVGGNAERMLLLLERYQAAAAWVVGTAVVLWILYKLFKWRNGMDSTMYASTNQQSPEVKLAEALLRGQAPDKGLYLPVKIPRFAPGELASLYDKSYPEIAAVVLGKFATGTFTQNELEEMCHAAYDFDVPLEHVDEQRHVMRLDRGPTGSFKDFAGLMMGRMFGSLRRRSPGTGGRLVILTATSGDTGSAIAHAFYKIPNVEVMVLFPPDEVSARQRKQMTTLGGNITAVGVEGKFDDCQALVKQAFADETLRGIELTSANSINIGRLLPQIVYYVYAGVKLTRGESPIVISVPSGNFGNMMGALLASRMGLPLEKLVVATNENDEVPRFMETGEYRKIVPSMACLSNAMNVGHPSNFARVIALFDGRLDEAGVLLRKPDMDRMRKELWATSVTDEETRETVQKTWRLHKLLLEPHGAVGWLGLERYLHETSSTATAVSVATAHPAKFPEEIEKLLGFSPEVPAGLSSVETKPEHYLAMAAEYGAFHKLLMSTYGNAD